VDGDGEEEIIIGTYDPEKNPSDGSLHVFSLDGALKSSVPVPGGLKHIPTLADVNGSGLDVIYRSLSGRVYIQNFGATNSGPVSWSTHRGNRQRDGNFGVSLLPSGTPLITRKEAGHRRVAFSWSSSSTPQAWRIYRAERPEGPFAHIVTLAADATSYTDEPLKPGCQYIYEVAAVYETNIVRSVPFALVTSANGNLIVNGGFEANDNSHWDKWFTGDIDWTNMVASTNAAFEGAKSMEITLINKGNNGSISQYGQYGTPDACLPVTPGQLYSFGCFFKSGGISEPSEHWLEWSSTKTGEDTNDRPSRTYPDYFTPHFVVGTEATDWTYANRTFIMPTGFPNVELGHRYSIAAPGSGSIYIDNVFFRALPSPNATDWVELLPFGAVWRYCAATPPTNWFAADFDDTTWLPGVAKFGAGGGPTNIVTLLPFQQPVYCFRTKFIAPLLPCQELLLSATCTDGGGKSLEVYLNGARLNTSGIDAVSGQGNRVQYYDLTPFIGLMKPGTNMIAVALNNVWQPGWDDVAFDLNLKATFGAPDEPRTITIAQGSGLPQGTQQINLNSSIPPNSVWRVESTDSLSPAAWQLVDVITNNSPGARFVRDTGQNGRLPPDQTPVRFYRLIAN
jgi:hypothetical protein